MSVDGQISIKNSAIVMCKPCNDDGKRVPTNGICQECEEHMCIACFGNHKKYTICKDHNLVDANTATNHMDYSFTSDVSEAKEEIFEVCPLHNNEILKFYCQGHDEVGCGDCMIMQHKACKVEYIRDIADKFKNSKEFSDIVSQIDCCQNEASKCSLSIKNNKIQIEDIHLGFLADVKTFRDKINAHLDKLEERLLQERCQVKETEKQRIESIETACEELDNELAEMSDTIVHKSDNPNKLFVTAIQYKHKTNEINRKLCSIMLENKISECHFQRNRILEQILQQVELGNSLSMVMDRASVSEYEDPVKNYEEHIYSIPAEVKPAPVHVPTRGSSQKGASPDPVQLPTRGSSQKGASPDPVHLPTRGSSQKGVSPDPVQLPTRGSSQKGVSPDPVQLPTRGSSQKGASPDPVQLPTRKSSQKSASPSYVQAPARRSSQRRDSSNWSLFEHQLRCEHLLMAGDYLSFKENERCEPGLFIGKKPIKQGTYFEVEIVSSDSNGNIGIGFVPKEYSCKQQPGCGPYSIGFHSRDGCIYDQDTSGERIGPPCTVGDVIGIGVTSYLSNLFKTKASIFFTRNRKKIREMETNSPSFTKWYPAIGLQSPGDRVQVVMNAKP